MGYRSEILICLKKENFDELQKRVRQISCIDNELMDDDKFDEYKYYSNTNVVVFGWNSLKWYSGFEIVETVEEYLRELEEKDVDYKFIRIGEDYGDIEIKENYVSGVCDHFSPIQDIEIY